VVFRVVACLLMFGVAILFSQWCLGVVALFMLNQHAVGVSRGPHCIPPAARRAGSRRLTGRNHDSQGGRHADPGRAAARSAGEHAAQCWPSM